MPAQRPAQPDNAERSLDDCIRHALHHEARGYLPTTDQQHYARAALLERAAGQMQLAPLYSDGMVTDDGHAPLTARVVPAPLTLILLPVHMLQQLDSAVRASLSSLRAFFLDDSAYHRANASSRTSRGRFAYIEFALLGAA